MSKYTPHTSADVKAMLDAVGLDSLDALYADVPEKLMLKKLGLGQGMSQAAVERKYEKTASENKVFDTVLRGCGAYDHFIPAAVRSLAARSEFVTAYTPYQPEISQGILQTIFEYQTLMCELTGMDVSNASVYDVGTAVGEAMIMACEKKSKVLVLGAVNPETVAVAKTYAYASGFELVEIPHKNGLADLDALEKALDDNTACVVAQSPNFFGLIEDMKAVGDKAHEKGAKFVYIFNPVSATVLVTPKECGADIAVGDGQPLGMPLAFGGPYLGILTCDSKMSRRMPGRVVGQTVDKNGKTAYVLTLQAREQHIRREKALSSICSNQALCALTAVVYLAVMGREGMRQVAEQCVSKAHYLAKRLTEVKGVKLKFDGEFFHEFAIETDKYDERLEKALAAKGILGGLRLDDGTSVWCATEKASKCALDAGADAFAEVK